MVGPASLAHNRNISVHDNATPNSTMSKVEFQRVRISLGVTWLPSMSSPPDLRWQAVFIYGPTSCSSNYYCVFPMRMSAVQLLLANAMSRSCHNDNGMAISTLY